MITLLGGGSSMAPFFFFSYVHDDNDEFLEKFFNDLRDEVAAVTTLDKADVAFRDLSGIGLMQPWRQEIVNALSTCECFVPLLTPRLIVHPYCGQEWEIFRRRLQVNPLPASGAPSRLMPILWRPLRGPLPPVISDHQRTHGTFGRPYAEDGLFMLLKQKEYDSEYARFLKRFVEMMIEAVQAAPLPASASPGDLESMPNAFQSANGRPAAAAQETSAADHVWLIIAAGAETELRGFRKDVAAYGTTGKQWRPFQRPCLEPALVAAQSVVAGEGLLSSPRLFDDEIIRQLTDSRDEIFVIMLDPWSVDLPPYRKALEWFDRQRFAGGSLLMIWAADVETRENDGALRARVKAAIPTLSVTGGSTALFDVAADRQRFAQLLSQIVTASQGRILETWADPRVVGGAVSAPPQVRAV